MSGRNCNCNGRTNNYHGGGLITQGSGRIDPSTGNLRLTVDDVPARIRETGEEIVVGNNEYIVNSGAVRKLGVPFLNNLNDVGLGNSTLPQGTGMYGNYQRGGKVTGRKNMKRGGRPRRRIQTGGHMHGAWSDYTQGHQHDVFIMGPDDPNNEIVGQHTHPGRTRQQMSRRRGGRTSGTCPRGQHWMPPANGQPGYCMQGSYHGAPNGNGNGNQMHAVHPSQYRKPPRQLPKNPEPRHVGIYQEGGHVHLPALHQHAFVPNPDNPLGGGMTSFQYWGSEPNGAFSSEAGIHEHAAAHSHGGGTLTNQVNKPPVPRVMRRGGKVRRNRRMQRGGIGHGRPVI